MRCTNICHETLTSKNDFFPRPTNQSETQGRTMIRPLSQTTHTKCAKEKNHHVFPCFLRQKHSRAVIRHAQGSSPWGASIQRLALPIEVPQQSWWEQAVSVSKYGEIFARKYLQVKWEILLKILWAAMKEGLRWGGATFGSRNVPSSHLISLCTLHYHHHHHNHNHHYHHRPAGRILVTNLELAEKRGMLV